jgi:flagellar basal-body rod protein FlgF
MADVLAIAEAAMRNSMTTLDGVSHNVANATTQGYKREVRVQAAFDAHMQGAAAGAEAARDLSSGALQFTGAPLHFAIEGDGWFQLRSPHGPVLTRSGAFRLDADGRLVSTQGWPVMLDADASVPGGELALRTGNELWSGDVRVGRFLLADVQGAQLEALAHGVYRTRGGAVPQEATAAAVRQGYTEGSNVNSLGEMVSLIQATRQAEAAQRMMRAYDEALETALTTLGEF